MKTRDKENLLTPTEFAKKFNLGRTTVWRWINEPHMHRRLKMYDASVVTIAGKNFVNVKQKAK
jgi:predicted DNA-binding transcriptional regulator AlpA